MKFRLPVNGGEHEGNNNGVNSSSKGAIKIAKDIGDSQGDPHK